MKTLTTLIAANVIMLIAYLLAIQMEGFGIELLLLAGFDGIFLMIHSASETHKEK